MKPETDIQKRAIEIAYQLETSDLPATVGESINVSTPEGLDVSVVVAKRIQAQIKMLAGEIKTFQAAKKKLEAIEEWLDSFLKAHAFPEGSNEVLGVNYVLQNRNCAQALEIEDESKIPDAYFEPKTTRVLNKDKLKQDLEMGVPVPGAQLVGGKALHLIPNTRRKTA
jgi:hypothetical protein